MKRLDTACGRMSFLKWIVFLILGLFLFLLVYGIAGAAIDLTHNIAVIFLAGLAILPIYYGSVRLAEKRKVNELGIKGIPVSLPMGLAIGVLMFSVITAILSVSGMYKVDSAGFDMKLLEAFANFFVVAVGEEVLFRGILFRMIDDRYGTWIALLVSALFFGIIHIGNDNATLWSSVAIALEAGLLLGLAYKCAGNLWLPIGIHWSWNFTQGNIFGFGVSGTDAGYSLINATTSGPEFLTGGQFGPEASIIAVAIGLIVSLILLRKMRKDSSHEEVVPAEN